MKELARGAEAIILQSGGTIIKRRVKKGYRYPVLDKELREQRTRREARILEKVRGLGIPVPAIVRVSNDEIVMDIIEGKKISEHLKKGNMKTLCQMIGRAIAGLHSNNIIHGDLTTSNMILKGNELYLIDFGLGFHSTKAEDKAVDIHLMRRALESRHNPIWEACFKIILDEYRRAYSGAEAVLKRLEKVEARGRYKGATARALRRMASGA